MVDLPYRPCVGIMLLNADNQIFIARRRDQSVEAWQMPQGGIDKGEEAVEAAFRELREETSVQSAELIEEADRWFTYDLPEHLVGVALKGKYRGQKQRWFAMRLTGADAEINLETDDPEFEAWKWASRQEVVEAIVPFKKPLYEEVTAAFAHLLNNR